MKNLRRKIRNKLRKTINEANPDQDIIDSILDKINKYGKDSLSDTESKYLDQASTGDVEQEVQDELELKSEIDKDILRKIKEEKKVLSVPFYKLKDASQEVIDKYIEETLKRGHNIEPYELELASQKTIDDFIRRNNYKENITPAYLRLASQQVIDDYLLHQAQEEKYHRLADTLKLASKDTKEKIKEKYPFFKDIV